MICVLQYEDNRGPRQHDRDVVFGVEYHPGLVKENQGMVVEEVPVYQANVEGLADALR
jgi:hypothetical protein